MDFYSLWFPYLLSELIEGTLHFTFHWNPIALGNPRKLPPSFPRGTECLVLTITSSHSSQKQPINPWKWMSSQWPLNTKAERSTYSEAVFSYLFLLDYLPHIFSSAFLPVRHSVVYSCYSQSTYSRYLEYNSVCPLVGIGNPPSPLPGTKEGVHIRLRVRGWGSPNLDDWRESLALCLLYIAFVPVLWALLRMRSLMVTRGPAAGTETTSLNPSSTSKTSSSKFPIRILHCISTSFDILSYTRF